MSYPEHPDTIVIKNSYYPQGINELEIWNYYQKAKRSILDETKGRDLMFEIMVDVNKPIIRRKAKDKYIRLDPKNYDKMITGRSVSIHSAMRGYEDFGIIDIDVSDYDGFKWAKKAALDVYDFAMDKMPFVKSASIRFTGKTSFHIVCEFSRKMKIDAVRFLLEKFLRQSDLAKVYTISGKRTAGVPNLDLAPNKFRGNYITLNSLSILGLRCMEVPYTAMSSFTPNKAKIK